MKIKNILILIWTGITAVASAIFYVLFRQAKDERNEAIQEKQQIEKEKAAAETTSEIAGKLMEEKKDNEELYKKAVFNTDHNDSFNASVELLQKLRDKSRDRHSGAGSISSGDT